jgi:hypothetical protein
MESVVQLKVSLRHLFKPSFLGFVCNLEKDISTTCNRPTTRFYFDADSQQCIPYVYGGCETNLNSFETETQCMRFCIGIGSDPLSRILNEDSNEMASK